MIHHVTLEVDERRIAEERLFWSLLGFYGYSAHSRDRPKNHWLVNRASRCAVSLHPAEEPTVPEFGHIGVVPPDGATRLLAVWEFRIEEAEPHLGVARAYTFSPTGHVVELLARPTPVLGGMPLEGA